MTLTLPSLLLQPATSTAADTCPDLQRLEGVGTVCPVGRGIYEVFDRAGRPIGFTHGPDPACGVECAGSPLPPAAHDSTVTCMTGAPGERYAHVIYARAIDDVDRYATMVPTIIDLVEGSNRVIDDAAIATNDRLSLRVLCAAGEIAVENAILPTPIANADFATIVEDLKALGFVDPLQKYWVFYDDATTCPCLGIAHIYLDDTAGPENWNNGRVDGAPMFAVVFNSVGVRPMLHELAHTLGAVQDSAPFSTLSSHCYDGRDIMCYNDGGPRGNLYKVDYCPGTIDQFDCGHNTYCNAYPAAGSYLDTHWQVCSRDSRYLVYPPNAPPVMESLSCEPAPSYPEESVTCSFVASDPAPGVFYAVDWGDGTSSRVPAGSGTMPPGEVVQASHVFDNQGTRMITVVARDNGVPPLSSEPRWVLHDVLAPNDIPAMAPLDCAPETPEEGDLVTCTILAQDSHNLSYRIDWGDGSPVARVPASGTVSGGTLVVATHTYPYGGSFLLRANATDDGRPPRTSATMLYALDVVDHNVAPTVTAFACTPARPKPNATTTCTFRAADDSEGVRYHIEWGDGTASDVPAAGFGAPSVVREATHAYPLEGHYTVSIVATDNGSPSLTSQARVVPIQVLADQEGPWLQVIRPESGGIYNGCDEVASLGVGVTPIFLNRGCIWANAMDPAGIDHVEVRIDGRLVGRHTVAPYPMEFQLATLRPNTPITVIAYDNHMNEARVVVLAHAVLGRGS